MNKSSDLSYPPSLLPDYLRPGCSPTVLAVNNWHILNQVGSLENFHSRLQTSVEIKFYEIGGLMVRNMLNVDSGTRATGCVCCVWSYWAVMEIGKS